MAIQHLPELDGKLQDQFTSLLNDVAIELELIGENTLPEYELSALKTPFHTDEELVEALIFSMLQHFIYPRTILRHELLIKTHHEKKPFNPTDIGVAKLKIKEMPKAYLDTEENTITVSLKMAKGLS